MEGANKKAKKNLIIDPGKEIWNIRGLGSGLCSICVLDISTLLSTQQTSKSRYLQSYGKEFEASQILRSFLQNCVVRDPQSLVHFGFSRQNLDFRSAFRQDSSHSAKSHRKYRRY